MLAVTDASGATVAGAGVTLVDEKTGKKIEARTDGEGQLRLSELPKGTYEITIMANGFRTLVQSHVNLPAREPLRFEIQIGAMMGEVVEIKRPNMVMSAIAGSPDHPSIFHRLFSGLRRIF